MKKLVLAIAGAVTVLMGSAAAADPAPPTLWITDDVARLTYNVDLDGGVITSFETPNTAYSSVAVDPIDGTLWGANEGSSSGTPPGKLVNYDRTGRVIEEIPAGVFGAVGTEGLALAIAADDDSLWVVDDPASSELGEPTVYNVSRSGELIFSFPIADVDPIARSPQGIAYDGFTSTLWITDNSTEKIYNVTRNGTLISSFSTDAGPFVTVDQPNGVENVQGIAVESPGILWITARDTGTIYRVNSSGSEVLQTMTIAGVDNPTGVAFDGLGFVDLGAASDLAVLGLPGSKLQMKDVNDLTGIVGDVGLGPDATQDFDEGLLTGTFWVDPAGDNRHANKVVISDGTVDSDLSGAVTDARTASVTAAALSPDQVFGDINKNTNITGGPGLNVIVAKKIELDHSVTLTLVGGSASSFVINLTEKFKLKEASSVVLAGGLSADNVLFNIVGTEDSAIESGSVAFGRILAPVAKMKIKGQGSFLVGAIIGGKEIKLENGGRLRTFREALAAGDIGEAAGLAVLALPGSKLKLRDAGSTVAGDVGLGPLAEQDFDKGTIDGTYRVDPYADNTKQNSVVVTGGTVPEQLSLAVADAIDASHVAAWLDPDQSFGDITSNMTIVGNPGINVIDAKKIELDDGETLTLVGDSNTLFVLNLDEKLKLKEASSIVLSGGMTAENILFNVLGDQDSSIESGSIAHGTILAPYAGKLKVKEAGSRLFGATIGSGEVIVEKGGTVVSP